MSGLTVSRFGFLWPQVVIVRKIVLVFISIYTVRPMDQLAFVTFVLLSSYGFCLVLRPCRRGDYIQFICTVAAVLTAGTGSLRYAINWWDIPGMWMVDVTFSGIQFVVVSSVLILIVSTFPRAVKCGYAKTRRVLKIVSVCSQYCTFGLKRKWSSCKLRRARHCTEVIRVQRFT